MSKEEPFEIQLIEEERDKWQVLAIELIKMGYKVNLHQTKTKLMVEKAWHYSKRRD